MIRFSYFRPIESEFLCSEYLPDTTFRLFTNMLANMIGAQNNLLVVKTGLNLAYISNSAWTYIRFIAEFSIRNSVVSENIKYDLVARALYR